MRPTALRLAAALLPVLAASAPLAAQQVNPGVGFGLGVGTRTGFVLSLGLQVTDRVGVVCKLGGVPHFASRSCGTHLYVFDDRDRFVVAEVGVLGVGPYRVPGGGGERREVDWIFVQAGLGWKDHAQPDEEGDGDDDPEYEGWLNASYSGGLTLVVAKRERGVRIVDGEVEHGPVRTRRALWPLFFLDGVAEIYPLGRECAKCTRR